MGHPEMAWIPQVTAELQLRSGLLPDEVQHWQQDADGNVNGAGIHQSQIVAIRILFEELKKTQADILAALSPAVGLPAFKDKRLELEQQLTGTHGILSIFRLIMGQRKDLRYYRAALDFADLVAADCYNPCIERAAGWHAIEKAKLRAPPLTYLNAVLSPAAFTRRHAFGAFRMPIEGNSELKLPISIVSLPFHHTSAVWTFCSLHHEVGHIIDQDLGLHAALRPALEAAVSPDRKPVWLGWLREMIADTFGVLLGHAGYAHLMTKLLLLPDAMVTELNNGDSHPTPYVRIMLLAALLKKTEVPQLSELADAVTKEWRESYSEPEHLKPFVGECGAVAGALMNSKIGVLNDHALRDFAPAADLAGEYEAVTKLALFLRTGLLKPPLAELRARLVPVAAQLATAEVTADFAITYADIQDRAVKYMTELRDKMPQFLPGPELEREDYYRQLVRGLNFSSLDEPEE
jgi:hypothetical protein